MSLTNLSWVGWTLGLGLLASGLFWLQRLRTRHKVVTVPTSIFWRAAAEEAPARTFVERFRHPWAYALILLICGLLWLAFGDPRRSREADHQMHIAVLDGSAGMSAGPRFERAVEALRSHLRSLPAERRQVLWCGAEVLTLLAPGEHELLLEKRLASLRPEAAPNAVAALLGALSLESSAEHPVSVMVFGEAPLTVSKTGQNASFRVERAALDFGKTGPNLGITALGVSDAQSGQWGSVDVYVEVAGSEGAAKTPQLQIELDGKPLDAGKIAPVSGGASTSFLLRGLPASGALLTVRLPGEDAVAADNVAQLRLPSRPRIRVLLSPSLEQLRPALAADPAVELVTDRAMVAIRREGEDFGANLPLLEFVRRSDHAAFLITHPRQLAAPDVLREAVEAIGLREVDAMALAEKAGQPIEVSMESGQQWRIRLWEDLLTPEFNFTRSRAFPLFLANSLRWLGRAESSAPYVAAGRPLRFPAPGSIALPVSESGRVLDTLGDDFTPSAAGTLKLEEREKPLAVSLLDLGATTGVSASSVALARTLSSVALPHPAFWLLLLALLLLLAEWHFYKTGRMP